jgi:hypothetical protein
MNVRELKELLETFDDDTKVRFSYDYGDHWHSRMATEVVTADFLPVEYSGYHDDYVLSKEDMNEEQDNGNEIDFDDSKYCVILSGRL